MKHLYLLLALVATAAAQLTPTFRPAKSDLSNVSSADIAAALDDGALGQSKVSGLTAALAAKAPLASPTFTGTVAGITKSMVGLGNVDNTSDANKPVSTLTSTALGLKVDLTSLSTTGGANKVPQFTAAGQFQTSASYTQGPGVLGGSGNILLPDLQGVRWMKRDGTVSNAALFHWQEHDTYGGETILQSPWRIAIIPNGPTQMGANDPARMPRKVQLVSGYASNSDPSVNYMPSGALSFQSSVWNGTNLANEIIFQAHALDTTGTNSVLRLWDQASVTGQDGGGSIYTAGRGDATGNLIGEFYKDGIWSPGTSPAFVTLTDGATVTQTCSKYKTSQNAVVTLAGNRTFVLSGLLPGMRGVLLVTQDGTGNRTLTPSGGSALGLSTTGGRVDRVIWDYDGTFCNWSVTQNVLRDVMVSDSDAAAFISQASLADSTQKGAVVSLVEALKSANLWTRFTALYPFVGGTSTAHAQDLKNTYDITWAGTVTHNANGVTGNATDARGDTGINLFTLGLTNSVSGYVYSKTQTPTDGGYFMGATTATTRFGLARNGAFFGFHGPNSQQNNVLGGVDGDFRRHFVINRSASNANQIYVDATLGGNADAVVAAPNAQIRLLCRDAAGSPSGYTNANLAFAAVGTSLSQAEWVTFRGIVTSFQTSLGRANP